VPIAFVSCVLVGIVYFYWTRQALGVHL
jgi:hypothetical protein